MPEQGITSRQPTSFRRAASALRRDRRGATLPMMVAGLLPAMAALGSAIDIGRLYLVRSQMQVGVDAAALAGARAFGTTDSSSGSRTAQVTSYFEENFRPGFLGAPDIVPVPSFNTVRGVNITTVSASTRLPMMFMQLFGMGERQITTTATAELQPKPLEVMLVLDDTGSMADRDVGGGTRMQALQNAVLNFNTVLHQGSTRRPELAMGFVTYTVTTNVGGILKSAGVAIKDTDGFTNVSSYTGGSNDFPANPLAWKGCVENDESIQTMSANVAVADKGAWDVVRSLPGEDGHPAVQPYLYPPSAPRNVFRNSNNVVTADYSGAYETASRVPANYGGSGNNNFFLLSPLGDMTIGNNLANAGGYRQSFYDYYIGLNANNDANDDVIVNVDDTAHVRGSNKAWKVVYSRVPFLSNTSHWRQPNAKYGYPTINGKTDWNGTTHSGYSLAQPTPNWQCPEPAMPIAYGRPKSAYDDYVRNFNHPLMPASGTLHHIGFLWGYRLLSRSDRFTRTNPIPSEVPLRALIFMTDGQTVVGTDAHWYGAYGSLRQQRITTSQNTGIFQTQVIRRFAKVCEAVKGERIPVYIVALKVNNSETNNIFRNCAGVRYYPTDNAATIKSAFEQIAVDLVDLHLTQ